MDCIFCKIVAGKLPCYKVYEDNDFLAFLDISPLTTGHTLVIPKKHYLWIWDVEPIGIYFEVCQKVAKHFQILTGQGLVIPMAVGEQVPHAHIHLLPTFDKEEVSNYINKIVSARKPQLNPEEAKELVEKLKLN